MRVGLRYRNRLEAEKDYIKKLSWRWKKNEKKKKNTILLEDEIRLQDMNTH